MCVCVCAGTLLVFTAAVHVCVCHWCVIIGVRNSTAVPCECQGDCTTLLDQVHNVHQDLHQDLHV